ncbi:MAG: NAD-dependent epimerase/dehydratase family protein [Ignavibacteria bacterium]
MDHNSTSVVTGASGFVGSHLVDLLLKKGHSVKCVTRKTSKLTWLEGKNIQIYDCGLNNKEELRRAFERADYIFHIAGVVKSKYKEGYFKGNVDTTQILLDAALDNKTLKKFVVVSSLTAAGPAVNGKPVDETTECRPITTYGRSKLAQEELTKSYRDKIPVTICRAPAIYGERDTEILIFFKTFNKGLMTTIGFNTKSLSLLHVKDLVNGLYLSAVSEKSAGETYFISSEKFYTWEEVGHITEKVLGKKPLKIKVPHFAVYSIASIAEFFSIFSSKAATLNIEKAKDITQCDWICDTNKAIKDLGYRQEISLEEGIKSTIGWYREMRWI